MPNGCRSAAMRMEDGLKFPSLRRHSVVYRFDAARGEVIVQEVFGPGMDWRCGRVGVNPDLCLLRGD